MDELDPSDFTNLRTDVVEERLGAREVAKAEAKQTKGRKAAAPPKESAPPPMPKKSEAQEKKEEAAKEKEFKQRQKLLDKILQYREKFKFLKKRNSVGIKSSMNELLDEVHYIQQQLGSPAEGGADNPACMALVTGMFGMEYISEQPGYNPLDLRLRGLGQTTQANIAQFEPILEEFMIKHGASIVLSVEWRLMLLIGTTIATVHSANNGMQWPGKIIAAQQLAEQKMAASALGQGL